MNKITLDTFIQKYNLGGNVNSVKWISDGKTLSTKFISGDKSLLGHVELNKQTLPVFEVGVYDTAQLAKMLGTLSDSIEFEVKEVDGTPTNFHLYDKVLSVDYVLAALGVIPDVPDLKTLPEFDTLVNLDSQFINSFIKSKSALSDVEHFTVQPSDGGVEFTIGYSDMNSNRISLKAQSGAVTITDPITFNANLFKDVLVANKECESATLEVSEGGLARINFKVDDYDVTYYLVAVQDVD